MEGTKLFIIEKVFVMKEFFKQEVIHNVINDTVKKILLSKIPSNDLLSVCLLFNELSSINSEFNKINIQILSRVMNSKNKAINGISFYSGLPLLNFCLYNVNGEVQLVKDMNKVIIESVIKSNNYKKFSMKNLELVNGLTGIARYLLHFKRNDESLRLLKDILNRVISICHDFNSINSINNSEIASSVNKNFFGEYVDIGISHGISGLMSLLAICGQQGVEVANQKTALKTLINFLRQIKYDDNTWPEKIILSEGNNYNKGNTYRPSWCYGNSGIASTLYLSGRYLGESTVKTLALNALLCNAPSQRKENIDFDSPMFCHGYAGYMHIALKLYREEKDVRLLEIIKFCFSKILSYYDDSLPMGFKSDDAPIVDLSFVTGIVSILLPLLDLLKSDTNKWDSIFLLS
ncbi:hypothetical protein FTO65_14905 [Bacillus cereus]|nr:hypothetical protein [Bacillus cereus]